MKKTKVKVLLFFVVLMVVISTGVNAQDPSGGPDAPPEWQDDGPEPPPAAPINQALPILTIAGVGLVWGVFYKKEYQKRVPKNGT